MQNECFGAFSLNSGNCSIKSRTLPCGRNNEIIAIGAFCESWSGQSLVHEIVACDMYNATCWSIKLICSWKLDKYRTHKSLELWYQVEFFRKKKHDHSNSYRLTFSLWSSQLGKCKGNRHMRNTLIDEEITEQNHALITIQCIKLILIYPFSFYHCPDSREPSPSAV